LITRFGVLVLNRVSARAEKSSVHFGVLSAQILLIRRKGRSYMNINQVQHKIGRAFFIFALLLGVAFVTGTTAQAQFGGYGRYGGYPNYQYRDFYRYAREQGRRDGISAGEYDARRGHRFNPEGAHDYRKATNGYDRRFGNKDAYKQAYREAFVRGYEEGYRRYSGYDPRYGRRRFPY
jgi:hypothetical protein